MNDLNKMSYADLYKLLESKALEDFSYIEKLAEIMKEKPGSVNTTFNHHIYYAMAELYNDIKDCTPFLRTYFQDKFDKLELIDALIKLKAHIGN